MLIIEINVHDDGENDFYARVCASACIFIANACLTDASTDNNSNNSNAYDDGKNNGNNCNKRSNNENNNIAVNDVKHM